MKNLLEIAVVHSIDDYAAGMFIENFFKWTGFSYYIHVYNEVDDNINDIFQKSSNHFDMIIYINDTAERFKSRFNHLAQNSISIGFKDGKFNDAETLVDMPEVIKFLINIYYKYNLISVLCIPSPLIVNTDTHSQKREHGLEHYKKWKNILEELNQYAENINCNDFLVAQEHLEFATLYCCYKINWLFDNFLGKYMEFDSFNMIKKTDKIYRKSNYNFYTVYHLSSLISKQSYDYKSMAISDEKACFHYCKIPFCQSTHLCHLGMLFRDMGKNIQARIDFEDAIKINPLNYRALYGSAIYYFDYGEFAYAESYLRKILKILQISNQNELLTNIKKLPPIELQYVPKIIQLLQEIERKSFSSIDKDYSDYLSGLIDSIHDIIGENKILASYIDSWDNERLIQKISFDCSHLNTLNL